MKPLLQLNPRARAYIGGVVLLGFGTGVGLIAGSPYRAEHLLPFALFTALGILASTVTLFRRGSSPSHITYQIGSSFAYPLLVLVPPGAICLALGAIALADRFAHRRRMLTTTFNVAQLWLSAGAALLAGSRFEPGFPAGGELGLERMPAAIAAVATFALVNHLLTMGVIGVVNQTPILHWTWITRTGFLNELLCVASGLGMAVFWSLDPWLILLGVIPIWTTLFMLVLLNRREQTLEHRERDLRSLQGLGLEIGAELDPRRLRSALLQTATEALQARGALLAMVERGSLRIEAGHGLVEPAPRQLSAPGSEELLAGEPRVLRDAELPARFPELEAQGARGLLLAPLEVQGKRAGLLLLIHGVERKPFDETDLRRMQTLVPFINVALSNSSLVAERNEIQSRLLQSEKMSALGMLVSGVAHELNNPLTAILGFAELLGRDEHDPRRLQMAERIGTETRRAAGIVHNLLTFSRKHPPERNVVDINQVIEDVLRLRAYELRVNNVRLVRRLDPTLPPVWIDAPQFQQVLLNLITNAEHAIEGGTRAGEITIRTRLAGRQVEIAVSDNGTGIAPEHLEQVFLPFFSTKEVGHGTGLGLSICYGIVEAHGGRIDVETRAGAGTTFVIRMPPAEGRPSRAAVPSRRVETRTTPPFRGRLLVVDDEETILRLVAEFFGSRGWTVLVARDGEEALLLLDDVDFDVLLVDLRMPGMDGQAFFEQLGRSHAHLAPRVIFATGDAGRPSSADFLSGRPNPVLIKPYDLNQLAGLVQELLAGPPRSAAATPHAGRRPRREREIGNAH